MKQGAVTPFNAYLLTRRISTQKFSEMLAKHLEINSFSSRTVEKWRTGERVPNAKNRQAIKALTGLTSDQLDAA